MLWKPAQRHIIEKKKKRKKKDIIGHELLEGLTDLTNHQREGTGVVTCLPYPGV